MDESFEEKKKNETKRIGQQEEDRYEVYPIHIIYFRLETARHVFLEEFCRPTRSSRDRSVVCWLADVQNPEPAGIASFLGWRLVRRTHSQNNEN